VDGTHHMRWCQDSVLVMKNRCVAQSPLTPVNYHITVILPSSVASFQILSYFKRLTQIESSKWRFLRKLVFVIGCKRDALRSYI
jgi:hypothetical protein